MKKKVILPTNNGRPVRFPNSRLIKPMLNREFSVNADGSVTQISPWLASQANRHCPDVHNLTGQAFIDRAVAWFTGERVKHNQAKQNRIPRKPVGLVNLGMEMESQLAHAGIRL